MKTKLFFIVIVISILICILGVILAYHILNLHFILTDAPDMVSSCHFNSFFSCNNEAKSRFTQLFSLPIAYIFASVYLYGIFSFIIWFFVSEERKQLILSGFLFFIFLSLILSLFIQISILFLDKTAGFYYPLLLIINLLFTLFYYIKNRTFLKTNIFDKNNYKEYRLKVKFRFMSLIAFLALAISFAVNYAGYAITKNKANEYLMNIRNTVSLDLPEDQEKQVIKYFVESIPENIDTRDIPFLGSTKSDAITVIEYTDFQCAYCRAFAKAIHTYMEKNPDKIRLYVVPFVRSRSFCQVANPVPSCVSAYASFLAYKKGKFKEYYEYLYFVEGSTESHIYKAAAVAGISQDEIKKAINDRAARQWVKNQIEYGIVKLQIQGTPSVYIDGRVVLSGAVSYNLFLKLIKKTEELRRR